MRLTPSTWAERILPTSAFLRVQPALARLDAFFNGEPDTSQAQRMAMVVFLVRVLGAALAYVSQVILARMMGSHEYGIYVVVWTLVVVLGIFAPLGFSSSVLRLIPEYRALPRPDRLNALLFGSRLAGGLSATAIAVIGILAVWLFQDWITSYYVLPLFLAAVCLPLYTIGSIQDGIARAYDWPLLAMLPPFIWRPIVLLGGLVLAIRFGAPATAATACTVAIVATWSVTLAQMLVLSRSLKPEPPRLPARENWTFSVWLKISLPILLVEGFFQLITSADVILVSFWRPPDEVAIYFAASKTPALAHFVYFAVRSATAHRYSRLFHSGAHAELATLVGNTARWTFWPTLALSLVLVLIGPFLLSLFGPGFESGYPVMLILLFGVLARASVGPVDALLTMADQQNRCAMVYALTFALNIALNITLIPILGILGAAIATAIAMMFEATALCHQARSRLGLNPFVLAKTQSTRLS
ncbi:lipopolysaccharide biosynthesis protein [Stappia stellulata]|uniref:lipopolysaccharide biosynthesis protein n=1 Tax=Stappia stellulata TaxID=71235 RepID=UPI0004249DD0|nr:lipopolysaccharide biosynthesis protein [Stappia stellulata]